MEVFDKFGDQNIVQMVIKSLNEWGAETIAIHSLASGVYSMRFYQNDNKVSVQNFIISK